MIRTSTIVTLAVVVLGGCNATSTVTTTESYAVFEHAAVAADHPIASTAGASILAAGGNAVDAAVATSFCLSVVDPFSCGIGGGGFMVIYEPATDDREAISVAVDYREMAPAAMGPTYFVDGPEGSSRFGGRSVGVPGTVAGLLACLERYGTMDRATVMAPAIAAAEVGFPANDAYLGAVQWVRDARKEYPAYIDASAWVWEHLCMGGDIAVGTMIRQPEQGAMLQRIADDGATAFYSGEVADAIVHTATEFGSSMTLDDLAAYQPIIRTPLISDVLFDRYRIITMPPPSSGGIAEIEILGIIDALWSDVPTIGHTDPKWTHLIVEAMKHAFANRARYLADPGYADVPTAALIDPATIDDLARQIDLRRTFPPETYGSTIAGFESNGTSHFSIIDGEGRAVACTETINLPFGSLVGVPQWGIVLNDEMDDFTTTPGKANAFGLAQSDDNLPAPGKRPLSSMSPTIVTDRNGDVRAIAGASGGPRIITGTIQVLLNVLLLHQRPADAVSAPRFHHQWIPDRLDVEETWSNDALLAQLKARGHVIGRRPSVGKVQLIVVDEQGRRHAVSDPRKGGIPAGH